VIEGPIGYALRLLASCGVREPEVDAEQMSTTLLVQRLRKLEEIGVVERAESG
jgi:DNA-binding HxlR family transcriptional regulator